MINKIHVHLLPLIDVSNDTLTQLLCLPKQDGIHYAFRSAHAPTPSSAYVQTVATLQNLLRVFILKSVTLDDFTKPAIAGFKHNWAQNLYYTWSKTNPVIEPPKATHYSQHVNAHSMDALYDVGINPTRTVPHDPRKIFLWGSRFILNGEVLPIKHISSEENLTYQFHPQIHAWAKGA